MPPKPARKKEEKIEPVIPDEKPPEIIHHDDAEAEEPLESDIPKPPHPARPPRPA